MNFKLNPKLSEFIKYCNLNNIDIYLVGGFVRDTLINRECFDVDICLVSDYNQAIRILKNKYKIIKDDKYQCIKFKLDEYNIEISHARKERDYLDYRHPNEIVFINDIKLDAYRRDFTINALYYKNNKIYDFYNGIEDLNNNKLKVIGNILTKFKEDPLRILRMIRFSSYGFDISKKDKQLILDNAYLLKELSIDSFEKEFDKILLLNNLYVLYDYKEIFEYYYNLKFKDIIKLNKLITLEEKKTYLGIKNKSNLYKYRNLIIPNNKLEINKLIYKYSSIIIKELIIYNDKINDSNLFKIYQDIIDNDFYSKSQLKLSSKEISLIVKQKDLISYYIDNISYAIMEKKLKNDNKEIKKYLMEMI